MTRISDLADFAFSGFTFDGVLGHHNFLTHALDERLLTVFTVGKSATSATILDDTSPA